MGVRKPKIYALSTAGVQNKFTALRGGLWCKRRGVGDRLDWICIIFLYFLICLLLLEKDILSVEHYR